MRRGAAIAVVVLGWLGAASTAQALDPDVTNDGVVNVLDASLVSSCLGADLAVDSRCRAADVDGDGEILQADLDLVAAAFGETGFPVDELAPSLAVDSPADQEVFSAASLTVTGTVDDESARVEVNGVPASVGSGQPAPFTAQIDLEEGSNSILVQATDAGGRSSMRRLSVVRDTIAPLVSLETPRDGAVIDSLQADVAGTFDDQMPPNAVGRGTFQVRVNGVEAAVANNSFFVPQLLLQPGLNRIQVVVIDGAGNVTRRSVQVTAAPEAGGRIVLLAGANQRAPVGGTLAGPIVVGLEDAAGDPVAGKPVRFEVSRGSGTLLGTTSSDPRHVTVVTDENGHARVRFELGEQAGAGIHRVRATARGFVGEVEVCASADVVAPEQLSPESEARQVGAAGEPLPEPFVVIATDNDGNPAPGANVVFELVEGSGSFDGLARVTRETNAEGRAAARLTLGPEEGIDNHVVRASLEGVEGAETDFLASSRAALSAATSLRGQVLDTQDQAVPGATVQVEGTEITATTDANGTFLLSGVPAGDLELLVDGSTTTREGAWPSLRVAATAVAGQTLELGRPIFLLPLDEASEVVAGGSEDVTLRLRGLPGAELTVFADSVQCLDGSRTCALTWTQVSQERIPMAPPMGSPGGIAATLQPAGTRFDPPARVCVPNDGMAPGTQLPLAVFDFDLGEFVTSGTMTVSEDGRQVCSDPGFGIVKAGWFGPITPPLPNECASGCRSSGACRVSRCVDGRCVSENVADGTICGDEIDQQCSERRCIAGSCSLVDQTRDVSCDDGKFCTQNDRCSDDGRCVGESLMDQGELGLATKENGDLKSAKLGNVLGSFVDDLPKAGKGIKPDAPSIKFSVQRAEKCCEGMTSAEFREHRLAKVSVAGGLKAENIPLLTVATVVGVFLNADIKLGLDGRFGQEACSRQLEVGGRGSLTGSLGLELSVIAGAAGSAVAEAELLKATFPFDGHVQLVARGEAALIESKLGWGPLKVSSSVTFFSGMVEASYDAGFQGMSPKAEVPLDL